MLRDWSILILCLCSTVLQAAITPLSTTQEMQMRGVTWHVNCPVPLSVLRDVGVTYWGFDGETHQGHLIVHQQLAAEVEQIFQKIYQQHFPMQTLRPLEEFNGDDEASMQVNNTSAFNCRRMTLKPQLYSVHSFGRAIDINPLINPYVNAQELKPKTATRYRDRALAFAGKLDEHSSVVKIFKQYGWQWGGQWRSLKDYHHFEKR